MNSSSSAPCIKHNSIQGAGADIDGAHGRQEDTLKPSLLVPVGDSTANTGYRQHEKDCAPRSGHSFPKMWLGGGFCCRSNPVHTPTEAACVCLFRVLAFAAGCLLLFAPVSALLNQASLMNHIHLGRWGMTANGYEVSFWGDESVLKLDYVDGCKAL